MIKLDFPTAASPAKTTLNMRSGALLNLDAVWNRRKQLSRDFKQCGILTSIDSDEPVQPPFKLRNSK